MSDELKPCSRCGCEAISTIEDNVNQFDTNEWCSCSSIVCPFNRIALLPEDWNTRPLEDALHKRLEVMQKQLNHVDEMLDDWFDESGEYLSPILIREQITYIKSEIKRIGAEK